MHLNSCGNALFTEIIYRFFVTMEVLCIVDGKIEFQEHELIDRIVRNENYLVTSMLENVKDVHNLVDSSGSTLLHHAVFYRNLTISKYLLDKGTKVDVQNNKGKTPLMLAAVSNKDYRLSRLICAYNANVCIVDKTGKNVLQMALVTPKLQTAIVELLLYQLSNNCQNNNEEIARKLFEFKIPLYHVVLLKNAEVTKILIEEYNQNVNAVNPDNGERAIHVAVTEKDLENVKVLVENNANVNASDRADKTPLFIYGVTSNYPDQKLEILKMLMDRGAEYKSNHLYSGSWQCFPLLAEGRREAVRLFLQYDIDLHARDQFDQTVIHYLASNDHPGILEELDGKNIDVRVRDDEGYTPLHKAIGNPSSVEYLIKKGVDINSQTFDDGESALYKAIARPRNKRYLKSIELLLRHDADIQQKTERGRTVFDIRRGKSRYLEPVLAHLALIVDVGRKQMTSYTRRRIETRDFLKKRYNFYKRQLQRMKVEKLCGVVTFYELLNGSETELARYARNPMLVLKLIRIDRRCKASSYYIDTLRTRLRVAIRRARAKERAAVVICRIMGISYHGCYAVADTIVNYLDEEDIQRLNEAFS